MDYHTQDLQRSHKPTIPNLPTTSTPNSHPPPHQPNKDVTQTPWCAHP